MQSDSLRINLITENNELEGIEQDDTPGGFTDIIRWEHARALHHVMKTGCGISTISPAAKVVVQEALALYIKKLSRDIIDRLDH
jgi:hypothetical protein